MRVVFYDSETGGLELRHPTIQIAAVAVENGREVGAYEAKLKFDLERADPEALAGNCYDADVWAKEAVGVKAGYKGLLDFFRQHSTVEKVSRNGNPYRVARVAGYNIASYDIPRLRSALDSLGQYDGSFRFLPIDPYLLDVYHLACWVGALKAFTVPTRKQQDLLAYYGIDPGEAHDALADARASAHLARALIHELTKGVEDGRNPEPGK